MAPQGLKYFVDNGLIHLRASLDAMVAIDQHFRFHDGYHTTGLADGGIACQDLCICLNGGATGVGIGDVVNVPPLGKPRTELFVVFKPLG